MGLRHADRRVQVGDQALNRRSFSSVLPGQRLCRRRGMALRSSGRSTMCHAAALFVAASVTGCGAGARLPVSAGTWPNPTLPPPDRSLIPLVHVVDATGWGADGAPVAADGTIVTAFARVL